MTFASARFLWYYMMRTCVRCYLCLLSLMAFTRPSEDLGPQHICETTAITNFFFYDFWYLVLLLYWNSTVSYSPPRIIMVLNSLYSLDCLPSFWNQPELTASFGTQLTIELASGIKALLMATQYSSIFCGKLFKTLFVHAGSWKLGRQTSPSPWVDRGAISKSQYQCSFCYTYVSSCFKWRV